MSSQATETATPSVRLARLIATAGGAGHSPIAPGTAGTIVAIPVAWALSGLAWPLYLGVCALVIAAGVWAAEVADDSWGTHDSGRIVIDEVAGYLVTVAAVDRSSAVLLVAGFVVFRAFDIAKPPPVRWVDQRLGGGLGVVLDDVAAGLYGLPLLFAMQLTGLHSHLAGW